MVINSVKYGTFLNVDSTKLKNTTLYKGTRIKNPEAEVASINFIEFNRKLLNPVTTWSLFLKLFEILP